MDASMMIVFGLLLFTMLMLILDILRVDLIALLVMLTLGWTGILSTQETLSGFSSNAVIAMISVIDDESWIIKNRIDRPAIPATGGKNRK